MALFKFLSIFLFFTFLFLSCETNEQDAINRAQQCLDEATPGNAYNCKLHIVGLESKEAYGIRCSANFLAEGLDSGSMATAFVRRDKTTTSQNPLLGMMGVLAFRSMVVANETYSHCLKSGLSSFVMFASMARMSTKIAQYSVVTISQTAKPTQEEMQDALNALIVDSASNDENKELIGESAVAISSTYCTPENASSKVCQDIASAVNSGSSNIDIGNLVIENLQNYTPN